MKLIWQEGFEGQCAFSIYIRGIVTPTDTGVGQQDACLTRSSVHTSSFFSGGHSSPEVIVSLLKPDSSRPQLVGHPLLSNQEGSEG
jgi:hypothetical protein